VCGPEAPLLVRRDALLRFLAAFPRAPFRQWQLTTWLVFADGSMVLQPHHVTASHDGCFDAQQCFPSGGALFSDPMSLFAAEGEAMRLLHSPNATHAERLAQADESEVSGCGQLLGGEDGWAALSGTPDASVLAVDSDDYAAVQGHNGVIYGYAPAQTGRVQTFRPLPKTRLPSWAPRDSQPWFYLSAQSPVAASQRTLHPSSEHDVAKVWTAPRAGQVHVSGFTAKSDLGGDGATFTVLVNGTVRYARYLGRTRRQLRFDVLASVARGEQVVLRASAGLSDDFDSIWNRFVIRFRPADHAEGG